MAASLAACSLLVSTSDLSDGPDADGGRGDGAIVPADAGVVDVVNEPAPQKDAQSDASFAYRETILADGPLSYLRLDESAGPVAHDETGAHDGVYLGAFTVGAPGAIAGATAV